MISDRGAQGSIVFWSSQWLVLGHAVDGKPFVLPLPSAALLNKPCNRTLPAPVCWVQLSLLRALLLCASWEEVWSPDLHASWPPPVRRVELTLRQRKVGPSLESLEEGQVCGSGCCCVSYCHIISASNLFVSAVTSWRRAHQLPSSLPFLLLVLPHLFPIARWCAAR